MTTENLAAEIGELKGTVKALQANMNHWMEQWSRQDSAATESRRDLHRRVEGLSISVTGMSVAMNSVKGEVAGLKNDIDTKVMPTVTAYNIALAQRAGMWLVGKFMWPMVLALCTVIGFIVHEGLQYFGGKLPFNHP